MADSVVLKCTRCGNTTEPLKRWFYSNGDRFVCDDCLGKPMPAPLPPPRDLETLEKPKVAKGCKHPEANWYWKSGVYICGICSTTLYAQKPKDQTMKKDSGKPSLFPILGATQALAEIAAVLHFGAKKYAPNKWREGMNWSRLIDALLRHVTAFANGESTDPETGLSHLGHAGCCVLFLLTYQLENLGTDDRWALSKKQD